MYPTITERERILVFKLPHNLAKLPFLHGLQAVEAGTSSSSTATMR
jgi:hypothetical protein